MHIVSWCLETYVERVGFGEQSICNSLGEAMAREFLFDRQTAMPKKYIPIRQITCLWLVCGACLFAGCSREVPEFMESARVQQLVPEARVTISKQLAELYGTPTAPRSPHWLPIDRGGTLARIEAITPATAGAGIQGLKLNLPEGFQLEAGVFVEPVKDPAALLEESSGPSGAYLAVPQVGVRTYDAAQRQVTFQETVSWSLSPGDEVMVRPNSKLISGQRLYDQHCLLCHGRTGDGSGPQSQVLNPKPRDFRLGLFKYTSTQPGVKASSEDLRKTIRTGIAGTGMPAFKNLGNHEVANIAEYVKFLGIRGETEQQLCLETEIDFSQLALTEILEQAKTDQEREKRKREFQEQLQDFLNSDLPEIAADITQELAERWSLADDPASLVAPLSSQTDPRGPSQAKPDVMSLANGRSLYLSKNLQCATCHGLTGKGDGEQTTQRQKKPDGSLYETPGLHDEWGFPIRPRDLTHGVFHGGRAPLDLYRRIHSGVKGTPMPAYGGKGVTEAEIWDLVNYVYYLAGEYPDVAPATLVTAEQP